MSSLIFYTNPDQSLVATDTLATTFDGEPLLFTTKAFFVPHLHLVMAGTGMGGFLGRWFIQINDRMIVRDINNLDYHTPKALRKLWTEYRKEYSIPDSATTTVYHFGYSPEDNNICTYVYRSASDFESELLAHYGIGTKPECQVPENCQLPKDIKTMMEEQRAIQTTRPKEERVYIGGKIIVHHLSREGCSIYNLSKFDDYEATEQAIFDNFNP